MNYSGYTTDKVACQSCPWTISETRHMRFASALIPFCCLGSLVVECTPADSPPAFIGSTGIEVTLHDWPWWRGPLRNGTAQADQLPPLKWSETENVLWKSPIPGRGHSSPTVVGEQLFLTTADDEAQYVLCFDVASGEQVWQREIHRGGFPTKSHEKSSHANSTIACDGQRIFVNFMRAGAVYTTALSRSGEVIWQQRITDYDVHQGYGSSPALYDDLVIVSVDNKSGGLIAGLDRATGEFVWKKPRPKLPNYPSPAILRAAGRDQVVMIGCELVSSFDPPTGETLWEVPGSSTETMTTSITNGELVYSSGGFPNNHIAAIRADGSGELVWENTIRVAVPSMVTQGNHLFAVTDRGIAICFDSSTGDQIWKHRLGGTFSASPVLVGDQIYATNESGTTVVYPDYS